MSYIMSVRRVITRYPVTRGMAIYALLLPASNTTQQLFDPNSKKYNFKETLRFSLFGGLILAPSLYCWVRLASIIVKAETLKGAIIKALIEQVTWAPFAYTEFYLLMNLMEGRLWDECVHQWKTKTPQTWKAGACVWPVVQTVNFWLVPMKNRVPFVACFSYLWNTFLSYMHHK